MLKIEEAMSLMEQMSVALRVAQATIVESDAEIARLKELNAELLAACKKAEAAIEDCRIRVGFPTSPIADVLPVLRAAIAKS